MDFSLLGKYYGVDWILMLTVFVGIFLLGEKKKLGFIVGMLSAVFGLIFSIQIASVANGVSSFVLLALYMRGYLRWTRTEGAR